MKIQNCLQKSSSGRKLSDPRGQQLFFGDLSAILIENMPIWAEFSSTPSNRISLMSDWETKIAAIINDTQKKT
jgi:hypothetical protein